jgi:hypothetical protein
MVYDASRGVLVLFGGKNAATGELADTWEFDGTTWTDVSPPTSPPARFGHAMAYDSARGVAVLFGGKNAATPALADTWEFDGTTGSAVSPPASPSARAHHAMVFDEARGVTVLFGGGSVHSLLTHSSCVGTMADTWEYDGTTWTEASPPASPSARGALGLAYDSARGVVVLFGGVRCEGSTSVRVPRLVDTETWEYDGSSWTEFRTAVTPSAQAGHAMAYDSARGAVLLFGCNGPDGSPSPTWEYHGP